MPRLILDGDARGAVKAQGDMAKAQQNVTKTVDESIRRVDELRRRQKQALAEVAAELRKQQTAQEKSNQTTQRALGFWRDYDRRIVGSLRKQSEELERSRNSQDRAFGAGALSQLNSYFAAMIGPGSLIAGATMALRNYNDELDKVGSQLRGGRAGLGQLAQLAITSPDPKGTMQRLVSEAKQINASGATATLGEAGELVFTLESAGITKPAQRQMISDMLAYGVIPEARNFSASIAALRSAYPDLTPEQLAGMGITAAIPSPGGAEQIIQHAGKSGAQARELGWKPEFALAATSILSRVYGGASEGGVRLEQFMKQVEHYGYQHDPALKGLDPFQTIERIQAQTGGERKGLEKYIGNREEALQGFRTMRNNLTELRALTGLAGGSDQSVVLGAIDLARNTPEIDAARQAIASENRRSLSRLGPATTAELVKAVRDESVQGRGAMESGLVDLFTWISRMSGEGGQLEMLRQTVDPQNAVFYEKSISPDLMQAIRRHLESIDRKTPGAPPPSGRQE